MAACCSGKAGNKTKDIVSVNSIDEKEMKTLFIYNADDLSGKWTIISIAGKEIPSEKEAFLQFDIQEKRVSGKAGCNNLNFPYEINSDDATAIVFKMGISTRMMCIDMEAEELFLKNYPEITSFSLNLQKDVATFFDMEKREILVLKKKE